MVDSRANARYVVKLAAEAALDGFLSDFDSAVDDPRALHAQRAVLVPFLPLLSEGCGDAAGPGAQAPAQGST